MIGNKRLSGEPKYLTTGFDSTFDYDDVEEYLPNFMRERLREEGKARVEEDVRNLRLKEDQVAWRNANPRLRKPLSQRAPKKETPQKVYNRKRKKKEDREIETTEQDWGALWK